MRKDRCDGNGSPLPAPHAEASVSAEFPAAAAKAPLRQLVGLLRGSFATAEQLRLLQDQLAQAFLLIEAEQQERNTAAAQLKAVEQRLARLETSISDLGQALKQLRDSAPAGSEDLPKLRASVATLRDKLATLDAQLSSEQEAREKLDFKVHLLDEAAPSLPFDYEHTAGLAARISLLEAKLNELVEIERSHLAELRGLTGGSSAAGKPGRDV
ncbi:MAG: hypothetical protein HYY96_17745 [Candidatus Tectomicrobia bacterium]|nr:hypothetical protein [Candidatus Tectomicrobia bacterium]